MRNRKKLQKFKNNKHLFNFILIIMKLLLIFLIYNLIVIHVQIKFKVNKLYFKMINKLKYKRNQNKNKIMIQRN